MKDTFAKATVVCAAVSCFGVGAYFVVNGIGSVLADRIQLANSQAQVVVEASQPSK
jgi:TPP-dependent 2-oxoacid decarboxylase